MTLKDNISDSAFAVKVTSSAPSTIDETRCLLPRSEVGMAVGVALAAFAVDGVGCGKSGYVVDEEVADEA